ncbi:MAG TPA: GNAT family N-acetyltransferase [Bacteroidetes bacterium]|nr:GNAT family N-acetyltransferase [Bacteroidota bacterium]
MNSIKTITPSQNNSGFTLDQVADFLFQALEQYGDERHHILACLNYAVSDDPGKGGSITLATDENKIVGTVVINKTGMKGFIPENILVYIAVDPNQRGKGTGKALMETVIESTQGDIALHVEPDNPAKRLYERLGFTNKYLEMRLHKEG